MSSSVVSAEAGSRETSWPSICMSWDSCQNQATCLAQDSRGILWIGTWGGLSEYDGAHFNSYTRQNGLPGDAVLSVATDSANHIWVGGQSWIAVFNGKSFTTFNLPAQYLQLSNQAQQIQIINDTVWWLARGELFFVAHGSLQHFNTPVGHGMVKSILKEKDGFWVAGDSAVLQRINGRWDTLKFDPGTKGGPLPVIRALFRDQEGTVWAVGNPGVYHVYNGSLKVWSVVDDTLLQGIRATSVCQDRDGAVWMGMSRGVLKISGQTLQCFNKRNGLSDNPFTAVLTDKEGNVWMASDGQGIYRFRLAVFRAG